MHGKVGSTQACPQDPGRCIRVPPLPPRSPTTRSPTCTLPLHQFRCNVFYEHADGMARARGKALPWDKKLTLANSKFTACIFIFLIPAPSASNWGSTLLFSPLFLQHALVLFFFIFCSGALQPRAEVGFSHPIPPEHPGCDQEPATPTPAKGTCFRPLQAVSGVGALPIPCPEGSRKPKERERLQLTLCTEAAQQKPARPRPLAAVGTSSPSLLTGII